MMVHHFFAGVQCSATFWRRFQPKP
jgi:hypothetical protein